MVLVAINNFNSSMNSDSFTEEINVSNILTLNFTYIEEKLKRNF